MEASQPGLPSPPTHETESALARSPGCCTGAWPWVSRLPSGEVVSSSLEVALEPLALAVFVLLVSGLVTKWGSQFPSMARSQKKPSTTQR